MSTNSVELVRHSPDPGIDDAAAVLRALAHEPRAVVYDLTIHNEARLSVSAVFDAVDGYLAFCSGTPLLVCTTDSILVSALQSHPLGARVTLFATTHAALAAAHLLPPIDRYTLDLDPVPEAAHRARGFVGQELARWEIPHLVDPAWSVITELVTNAVIHAAAPITASISRPDHDHGAVRLAVRDGANTMPMLIAPTLPLHVGGLGIWLVNQLARGWGTVPLGQGKIVWAVLDGSMVSEERDPLTD